MDNKLNFDPLAWASQKPAGTTENDGLKADSDIELAKVEAVVRELERIGGPSDSYKDWYCRLGFALADGLGSAGGEYFHRVSRLSPKYNEAQCEKKWQQCLEKHDGRTQISAFYNLAKEAGVDLSAIARQYPSPDIPSKPQNPHGSAANDNQQDNKCSEKSKNSNTQTVTNNSAACPASSTAFTRSGEESEVMRFSFSRTFSQNIDPAKLPVTLQRAIARQETDTDKDKVMLAILDLLAMAEPNVYGIYGGKRVYTPFYLFILGPAGISLKGAISDAKEILMPIDEYFRNQYYAQMAEYKEKHAAWEAKKSQRGKNAESAGVEPEEPVYRRIFISADSSASSFKQDLYNFGGRGIIFSTEADTLTQALGQEWGQFTDAFRQAFHHESIESSRTKDKLRIIINEPQLGILVTCTPQQIVEMLSPKQSENGTSSRDLFYCTEGHQEWIDPFQTQEPTADYYKEIGKDVKRMYEQLEARSNNRIQILISEEHRKAFSDHFRPLLPEHIGMYGEDFAAFTVRIALVAFRMMMILTTVRNFEKGNLSDPKQQAFVITHDDYETAMTIIDCLVEHTAYVYKNLLHPSDETPLTIQPLKGRELQLYLALPDEFTTKMFNEKAKALGIPLKTAQRYLGNFISRYQLIERVSQGNYVKVNRQKQEKSEQ